MSTNSLTHFKEITKIIHIPGLLYHTLKSKIKIQFKNQNRHLVFKNYKYT